MSLIEDVRCEMAELDASKKKLRSFGILMGTVFCILTLIGIFKNWAQPLTFSLAIIALLLATVGWLKSGYLRSSYRVWMLAAAILGWVMARFLLGILFYCVITPTGIIGKLVGKKFLDTSFRGAQQSFWVTRDPDKKPTYEKLY
jgi:hypothetical protein